MPILDLQRRATQIGRIRLGTSEPYTTRGGKAARRPVKLSTFRFTSRDRDAMAAIAEQFGGEVRPWADAPTMGQWEVTTEADQIDVAVPPGPNALSQWYEHWSGGGCERRCDGRTEQKTGGPCVCDPQSRVCKPTTRIALILADVPGLGVWEMQSHGWNAAAELGGTAEFLATVREAGVIVPAVLRIEARRVVSEGQTKDFMVPVLTVRSTLRELATGGQMVALPPAPANQRAIAAPRGPVDPDAPDPTPGPAAPPTSAADMARWVETCPDLDQLNGVGARHARGHGWMDTFVSSKYAPEQDELIELVEVFRARGAELRGAL